MSGKYRLEKNCLNCGHHVEDHYCSHCGQPNLELKEPFWGFIAHSVGHYFHFDSKFFHTLVPLLTKPGQITLDYLAGKRARYIHPVSLYIFVSILYFLIVPHAMEKEKSKEEAKQKVTVMKDSINAHQKDLKDLPDFAGDLITQLEFKNLDLPAQDHMLDSLRKTYSLKPSDSLRKVIKKYDKINAEQKDTTLEVYELRQKSLPAAERDSWIDHQFKKKQIYLNQKKEKDHWDIKEEVKKYQPKQFFLLMPLLAFFIMINFRKNRIYYIDHLVFTIHGMTAFFIVSIVAQPLKKYVFGLSSVTSGVITVLVFAAIVWYMYTGLKLFYKRSVYQTIKKTFTLIILYGITFALSEWVIRSIIKYLMA
ncbi:DUF3667 domain-containing protein [Pedobacter cryoconitis]|uniref:DUF3667 domain-containing protein n=1 Tax=Pedobacter cryoconitis TaxID=188932 RepID=A0A7X0MHB5_9SPHI|nr:DUF3667 domain-containing protein [Pedobacter cryoconitis]MBB6498661.1 hypothetical protein [Pedobacter cryoconitis]